MCDKLGRSLDALAQPTGYLVLPQEAYRRVVDFLRCEHTFSHYVMPTFLHFGWVVLGITVHESPLTHYGGQAEAEAKGSEGAECRKERARKAVRLALAQQKALQSDV